MGKTITFNWCDECPYYDMHRNWCSEMECEIDDDTEPNCPYDDYNIQKRKLQSMNRARIV